MPKDEEEGFHYHYSNDVSDSSQYEDAAAAAEEEEEEVKGVRRRGRTVWLKEWNRIFLAVSAVGLFVDPLFFYTLSISESCMCLFVDGWFAVTLTVLRCMIDAVNLSNLFLHFSINRRLPRAFLFDVFVILPLPQIVMWVVIPKVLERGWTTVVMTVLLVMFVFQYLPKIYHSVCLLRRMQNLSGYIFGTVWWGIALNLIAYFVASHAVGACWYLLGIQRAAKCLKEQCMATKGCDIKMTTCQDSIFYGTRDLISDGARFIWGENRQARSYCLQNLDNFDYGAYKWTIQLVTNNNRLEKILFPIFWGLMTLSTFGNLESTTDWLEVVFIIIVLTTGLLLVTMLIGNIKVFLHATTSKKQAMQLKMRNIEWWMGKRQLPMEFRQRVRNYERQRWAAMRGVDEGEMTRNLPEGLRRDIKYHLCLDLVRQVPLFHHMDNLVLENICDRVKSLIFTKGETISKEGDPVQRMLFIVRGHLESRQVVRDGVKSCCMLGPGNFSGDELLSWCLRKPFVERLPPSSSTLVTLETTDRDNAGSDVISEKKRARLDLFEFDEYDVFDEQKIRNEFLQDRIKRVGKNVSENELKRGSHFDGSSSGKSKGIGSSTMRNKGFSSEDDDGHMPIASLKKKYQETAAESIRLQGKNGVLKVMVNKKKRMDLDTEEGEIPAELQVYPDSKTPKNRGKERIDVKEQGDTKVMNPIPNKERKARDSGAHVTDTVVKLATPKPIVYSSKKAVKKEAQRSPITENVAPLKGKEGKESNAKRGGSTEKQMLREKIKGMLIDAGWSIDYRPRRNRDYLDAVYINPSGTAYWSIIKAYDAFKKQLGNDDHEVKENNAPSSLATLSKDLVSKLTRKTKKKIAEEHKRKRKENGMAKSAKKSAVKDAEKSSESDQSEEQLSSYMKQNQKLRGKFSNVDPDSDDNSSDDSFTRKPRKVKFESHSSSSKSNAMEGRSANAFGRCTLLIRGSDRGDNSDFDGYVPYKGKRTILAWLIDCGTAKLSEKVQYKNRRRTRVMLEGWITRDGIHCVCCSKILTVSKFELHAGSKLRQPFQNIFLESGSSLLQCQIDAWNSQEFSDQDFFTVAMDGDDPDDDACGICGDGGDLICCDSCPSTFHQICLGIQTLPSGDWHCPNCICKFCGLASGNLAEENDIDCDELNRCTLCEKKFHKSCSGRLHAQPTSSCSASFCGLKCQEIYDHLQKILGVKRELEAGISWSLIQRANVSDVSQHAFPLRVECNSKLAVALSVMEECFLPIIDRRSGINIIRNVVYNFGSNFNRLNYHGFYTAILERGDEILAAASIRFHGDRLAEMPFIGTRETYRRQGMCRRLLSAIETELCSLKVGQLVIPAVVERMDTWTTVFGFDELEDVHKKDMKSLNMLVFPGTDMLQKQLVKQENADGIVRHSDSNKKVEVSSSGEQKRQASSDSGGSPASKTCDEVDSGSPVPAIPSDAIRETGNPTSDAACESEMENKQKKSRDNLECSPIPAKDSSSISDEEHTLPVPPVEDAVYESEMENKQKKFCDNLESSPIPAKDSSSISDEEHTLPVPPVEDDVSETEMENEQKESSDKDSNISDKLEPPSSDDSNSVKAAVEDSCKTEDSRNRAVNSVDARGIENGIPDSLIKTLACSERASEDAAHSKTQTNGCVDESFPGLVPAEVNTGASTIDEKDSTIASNGENDHKALDGKTDGVDPGVVRGALVSSG